MKGDEIDIQMNKKMYNIVIRLKGVTYKVIFFVKAILAINSLKIVFFSCFCYILALTLSFINNR